MKDSNRNHFKWFILAGAFMTVLTAGGFRPTIGMFILEWQEEFHDASTEQIGWIGGGFMAGYAIAGKKVGEISSKLINIRRNKAHHSCNRPPMVSVIRLALRDIQRP